MITIAGGIVLAVISLFVIVVVFSVIFGLGSALWESRGLGKQRKS